ncbi:MAG: hypothetical protein RLZZ470_854 [Pseudomonadota bacterium]|jgi:hypothetical protein
MHKLLVILPLLNGWGAWAHEGHGLDGAHAHATDALGFVVTLVVVAAMIWTGRK